MEIVAALSLAVVVTAISVYYLNRLAEPLD